MFERPGTRLGLRLIATSSLSLLLSFVLPAAAQDDARHGTFLRLLDSQSMTVDHVATGLADAFASQGLQVLANTTVQLDPEFCSFGARLLVLHDGNYALHMLEQGPHAVFAIPLRIAVYEDETGVHAAAVNPLSLNRTLVAEEGMSAEWVELAGRLEAVVAARFPQDAARAEFGQWRDKGRIGKTMGIMAGGPFREKVKTLVALPAAGTSVADVAARIKDGTAAVPGEWEWGM